MPSAGFEPMTIGSESRCLTPRTRSSCAGCVCVCVWWWGGGGGGLNPTVFCCAPEQYNLRGFSISLWRSYNNVLRHAQSWPRVKQNFGCHVERNWKSNQSYPLERSRVKFVAIIFIDVLAG